MHLPYVFLWYDCLGLVGICRHDIHQDTKVIMSLFSLVDCSTSICVFLYFSSHCSSLYWSSFSVIASSSSQFIKASKSRDIGKDSHHHHQVRWNKSPSLIKSYLFYFLSVSFTLCWSFIILLWWSFYLVVCLAWSVLHHFISSPLDLTWLIDY